MAGFGEGRGPARADGLGDAEVGHEDVPAGEQDVLGLDVAVDNAVRVRGIERAQQFARDAQRVLDRELAFPGNAVPQRLPLDVGHDEVEHFATADRDLAAVVHREDVRMLQPGRNGDFAEEALAADGGGHLRPEHLDGDLTSVLQVIGEIDNGHAPAPELAHEAVLAGQGVLQVGEEVHGIPTINLRIRRRWARGRVQFRR